MLTRPWGLRHARRIVVLVVVGMLGWAGLGTGSQAQTHLSPGTSLPAVESSLDRLDGTSVTPQALLGKKATVFVFWSNQCPWIDRYEDRVQALVSEFQGRGVQVVRINANDASASSAETLEASQARAEKKGYSTPYVRDPNGAFAQALGASRTPQAFVFNKQQMLVYVGAIDDNPSGAEQVDTPYLRNALEALLTGKEISTKRTHAFGCSLKMSK